MAEIDEIIEQPSDSEKRIKQLSDKVKLTSTERDELKELGAQKDTRIAELEKENTFNSGFTDILSTNPDAKDFKDDIKSKVMSGMSVEDATFAVLGKAGKLNQPVVETQTHVAGGSATTTLPSQTERSIGEMTQAERRAELASRADLGDILAPRSQ